MSEQIIVGVPRVPAGMLERTALRDRIGTSPLTIVRAPGGAGKTVLMAQWAGRARNVGAWVTVEPDIGNRVAFWSAVFDGVTSLASGDRPILDDGSDREVLRGRLLRAFHALAAPFVLVLDDIHELGDPTIVDDVLAVLHGCSNVTIVAGTRTRTELEAPSNALTLDIAVIGPDELVLSSEEIAAIVGEPGSRYGTATELLEASGGNPLLLRAILAGSAAGAVGSSASAHVIVLDYLRGLFEREGAELAMFTSTTAIPDDLDVALAAQLSGIAAPRVGVLLAALEADGLVMRRDSSDGVRYRYHPLVREVLRAEQRRNDLDRFQASSLIASAAAEHRGQFLAALRHAVDAEDYSRASDVVFHGSFPLIRARGAAAILAEVPMRHVARLPFLAVVLGLAANARGDRWKALQLLTLALGASRASRGRQRPAERAGLALIETVVLRITGRAGDSVAPAKRLLAILDEAPLAELEEIAGQVGSYRLQAATSQFRAGLLAEAKVAAEHVGVSDDFLARGVSESLGAAALVAAIDAIRGDRTSAEEILARIDAGAYSTDQLDGYVGSLAHLARGILRLEDMDGDAAAAEFDLFVDRPNLETGMMFSTAKAFADLWRGTPDVALRTLEERDRKDRPRARVTQEDRPPVRAARVLLHAALGRMGPAYEELRGLDRSSPVAMVLRAHLYLLEQRPDLVIEQLSERSLPQDPRLRSAADLLLAVAALQRSDEDVAEAALRRFFATLQVNGTLSPVVLVPAELRDQLYEFSTRIGAKAITVERLRSAPTPFHTTATLVALSPREAEILSRLRATGSVTEIAALLHVSPNTVKSQLRTLYRKLGVSSRDEALRAAYLQGLLLEGPVALSE